MPPTGTTTPIAASFFNAAQTQEAKTVILQALERWVPYPEGVAGHTRVFYPASSFQGTEQAWNRVPLIFSESGQHPNHRALEADMEKELARIQGRVAGMIQNAQVITGPGQPRATCSVGFTDPKVAALYNSGKLALSTGFDGALDVGTGHIKGTVVPNHVLAFQPAPDIQPRDGGAMFLNTIEERPMTTREKIDKALATFGNSLKEALGADTHEGDPEVNPDTELQAKLEAANNLNTEKDKTIAAKDQEVTDLKEELQNTKKELETFRTQKADEAWEQLKNTQIPPGMVKKEEDEKALRELYNTNKDAFYQKLIAAGKNAPQTGGQQGAEFNNGGAEEEDTDLQKLNDEWDQLTGASN